MTEVGAAAAALDDARAARARLADKVRCPPYMHTVFGALYGVLVAAQGSSGAAPFAIEGVVVVVAAGLFIRNRQRMGFFVNGYRRGRTRWVVAALLIPFAAAMALAGWSKEEWHLAWPALVLGLLMFGIGTWASYTWQQVYRRELDPGLGSSARGPGGAA